MDKIARDESRHDRTVSYRVQRITRDGAEAATRLLANETPVAMEFDGSPYAVMMLTPDDLEDFAAGFALTERIISGVGEIARIDVRSGAKGIAIDVRLEKEQSARLAQRRRMLAGQTGCGLCGIMTLDEVLPVLEPLAACPPITASAIFSALDALPPRQDVNRATGAVHAAAFCRADGSLVVLREDVGRHNALDKVIGHLARHGIDPAQGFALVTSRCSYELVQKTVLARIPMLVAISAPTALAVEIAGQTRLTMVALARPDAVLLFNDPFGTLGAEA